MNTKARNNQATSTVHVASSAHHADDAVRALYQQLMNGWNKGNGEAFAFVFTEDGDLVAFDSTHFHGRTEIAPFHQELFDTWLKGSRLVGQVKDVRFLSPQIALMHAVGSIVMRGTSQPSPTRDSIQTLVAVQKAGEWRLAVFQNTRLRQMGRSVQSFFGHDVFGLGLEGSASETLSTACRPTNRSSLQMSSSSNQH